MPKALDLTNQKFGKLIALERAPKRNDKYTRWKCQCECGKIIEVRTDYLRNGHTTSCGCTKAEYFQFKDLIGQKFGRLTVIENLPNSKKRCKCDCGNIVDVTTVNLTSGNTQSCGCYQRDKTHQINFQSLIGQRFGKLVVIEQVPNNKFNQIQYKCRCDCGGITIVSANNLRQGITNSCGCLKSKGEIIINNWLQEHSINFIPQYTVEEIILDSGRHPFFDFAIFNSTNKLIGLIEYNGKQHYEITGGWNNKENFEKTQNRDTQKQEWCKKLNIPLYIISYKDNIDEQLETILDLIQEEENNE